MPFEPTTLAAVGKLIAETLESHYHTDAKALFDKVGIDSNKMSVAGARYPRAKIMELWEVAAEATGDPCIGVLVGLSIRPTSFHALSFSWLASRTLLEALQRLCRYYRIIVTVPLALEVQETTDGYLLKVDYPDEHFPPSAIALDSFLASIIKLCRTASSQDFNPLCITLTRKDSGQAAQYSKAFGAPVIFASEMDALYFDKASMETELPGNDTVLARVNDKLAEQYLDALEPHRVESEVRRLLVGLLPTGNVDQEQVARLLNRSTSALRRQLRDEGANYREVLDETRRALAERYLRENKYSLCQITYLLGFSDQSNFSRAFKRWTGSTPRDYQLRV